jgi:transposase
VVSNGQRRVLERLSVSRTAAHPEVVRARVLLLAADGVANDRIAAQVGVTAMTVRAWRARFTVDGLSRFGKVARGRGRKATIPQEVIEEIVDLTQNSVPHGQTQLEYPDNGQAGWVSKDTTQRVWSARGLKPHLVKKFKPCDR